MWLKQTEQWVSLHGLRRLRLKHEPAGWLVLGVDDNRVEHRINQKHFDEKGEALMFMDELGEKLTIEEKKTLTVNDLEDIKTVLRDVFGEIKVVKEGKTLERKSQK